MQAQDTTAAGLRAWVAAFAPIEPGAARRSLGYSSGRISISSQAMPLGSCTKVTQRPVCSCTSRRCRPRPSQHPSTKQHGVNRVLRLPKVPAPVGRVAEVERPNRIFGTIAFPNGENFFEFLAYVGDIVDE